MNNEIDSFQKDILNEVASVAAGKALRPISAVTGQRVRLVPPELMLDRVELLTDAMGRPDENKTIVFTEITGQAKGAFVLLIDPEDVSRILPKIADEMKTSTLEEIANMMAGAALGAISRLLDTMFLQSTPVSTTDMLRAVITQIASEIGQRDSQVLCLKISLQIGDDRIPVVTYLMFDSESTNNILAAARKILEQ